MSSRLPRNAQDCVACWTGTIDGQISRVPKPEWSAAVKGVAVTVLGATYASNSASSLSLLMYFILPNRLPV
jgi:hypothetical protein